MNDWIAVATEGELFEGAAIAVTPIDDEIAIYKTEAGEVFATDNICTHDGHGRLCEGWLEGYEIECPLHQGKFDVCTGQALCAPLTENIRTYPVRIVDRRVLLNMA